MNNLQLKMKVILRATTKMVSYHNDKYSVTKSVQIIKDESSLKAIVRFENEGHAAKLIELSEFYFCLKSKLLVSTWAKNTGKKISNSNGDELKFEAGYDITEVRKKCDNPFAGVVLRNLPPYYDKRELSQLIQK